MNTVIGIICHSLLICFISYISLLKHLFQNHGSPHRIIIGVGDRIISAGITRDGSHYCRFGEIQFRSIFPEVSERSRLDAKSVLPEIYRIKIKLQYIILRHARLSFKLDRQILFLNLSFDLLKFGFACCPLVKNRVFYQLLGNRTCSLRHIPGGQNNICRPCYTLDIYAVMLVESFILHCYKCMLHINGDLIYGLIYTV